MVLINRITNTITYYTAVIVSKEKSFIVRATDKETIIEDKMYKKVFCFKFFLHQRLTKMMQCSINVIKLFCFFISHSLTNKLECLPLVILFCFV